MFVTVVEPGSFIDTHCLYHQRVSLPMTDRGAVPLRIILEILRMPATIRINQAIRALRFRKYCDNIGMLNNHVRMDQAADGSYRTKGKTSRRWILGMVNGSESLLPVRRQKHLVARHHEFRQIHALALWMPHASQIGRRAS